MNNISIKLRAAAGAIGLCSLLAGWVFLYTHSHAVDSDAQAGLLQGLRDIKQLDAGWTLDVLRTHADVNPNYDALAMPLQPMAAALTRLRGVSRLDSDETLRKALEQLRSTIGEKSQLIDRFKAQNSLFKNSLRYVPTAGKEIQLRLASERDAGMAATSTVAQEVTKTMNDLEHSLGKGGSDAEARDRMQQALAKVRGSVGAVRAADNAAHASMGIAALQGELDTAVNLALHYSSVPDDDTATQLKAQIQHIGESVSRYPQAVQEGVSNLRAHLDTVLRLRGQQAQLLQEISRQPVATQADALSADLGQTFALELQTQFRYQQWLLGYSALSLAVIILSTGLIMYRSITERRRLSELVRRQTAALKENEVHLIQAQKMSAIGELTAGLAHEVNTPLAAVKSSLQSTRELMGDVKSCVAASGDFIDTVAARRPEAEAEKAMHETLLRQRLKSAMSSRRQLESFETLQSMEELLQTSLQSVDHISQVVINMLNFSRLDRTKVTRGKLEDGIDSTLAIANHLLKDVKLIKDFGATPEVECDLAQINQVVLNLVKNGVQAMPEGHAGELRLRTQQSGDRVVIEVSDNGSGIPADVLPKIWDPFFTTKPEGVGTGLGLSTCRKIIKAHGGTITVASTVGTGTTFTISLPVKASASLQSQEGNARTAPVLVTA